MTSMSILGTGSMARGIAARALAGGHSVQLLGRDAAKAQALATDLGADAATGSIDEAFAGDVVVLALPYDAATAIVRERAAELAGKVVIDITNPVDFATFDSLVTPAGSSAAEELAKLAPGARLVKAFNTTFAGTLVAGEAGGQKLDVLVASDDEDAKAAVAEIVESSGMRAVDAGPVRRARQLENVGFLHMTLQGALGNTWSTGVKIIGA